jgi:hypothetical protein
MAQPRQIGERRLALIPGIGSGIRPGVETGIASLIGLLDCSAVLTLVPTVGEIQRRVRKRVFGRPLADHPAGQGQQKEDLRQPGLSQEVAGALIHAYLPPALEDHGLLLRASRMALI